MLKNFIIFLKKLVRRNKGMKALNIEKVIKSNKKIEEWEILCDTCANIAEKAHWTEEDSNKLIKHVRKELREK